MHLKTNTAYAEWDHTVEFEGGVIVRLLPPSLAALNDAPPATRADLVSAAKGLVPEGSRAVMEAQSAAALVQFIQFYETLAAEWRAAQARAIAAAAATQRHLTAEARSTQRKAGSGKGIGGTTLESWREQVGSGGRAADGGPRDTVENPPALKLARELREAGGESAAG